VDAVVADGADVDVEQPAFVSPQHVVRIGVEFEFDGGGVVPIYVEIEFTTVLHVRYPAPILKHRDGGRAGFITVQVHPAYLYRGSIQIGCIKDEDEHCGQHHSLYTAPVLTHLDDERWKSNRLSLDIAAGRDCHHDTVVFVTVLISFIGALSMLRDLSQAAVWC